MGPDKVDIENSVINIFDGFSGINIKRNGVNAIRPNPMANIYFSTGIYVFPGKFLKV